jgi:hypothetical protein
MVTIHAPGGRSGETPDHRLDVGDRPTARERGIEILEALTVHVGVGVDEPRHDGGAA